jgi:hypothetical protein
LAYISGGHGRSIEYLLRSANSPYQKSLKSVVEDAALLLTAAYQTKNVDVYLKAVLLGEPVLLEGMIGDESYESLVSRGIFLNSFEENTSCLDTYVPMCPELFLHSWVHQSGHLKMSGLLHQLLEFRDSVSYPAFESFHGLWEEMIRFARSDLKYKSMPLREVYRIDLAVPKVEDKVKHNPKCTENATKCPVDAQSELSVISYAEETQVNVTLNTILEPQSSTNAGWDRLIFYEAFPTGGHTTEQQQQQRFVLPVFIQNKWSKNNSSTTLGLLAVQTVVGHCRAFLETNCQYQDCQLIPPQSQDFPFGYSQSPFVVLSIARQDSNQNTTEDVPTNVMFCFEEELGLLYGPTLASFVKYLLPNESHEVVPIACGTILSTADTVDNQIATCEAQGEPEGGFASLKKKE